MTGIRAQTYLWQIGVNVHITIRLVYEGRYCIRFVCGY